MGQLSQGIGFGFGDAGCSGGVTDSEETIGVGSVLGLRRPLHPNPPKSFEYLSR